MAKSFKFWNAGSSSNAVNPPNVSFHDRAPTINDYKIFERGDIWINPTTKYIYVLVSKGKGNVKWTFLSAYAGSISGQLLIGSTLDPEWGDLTSTGGTVTITHVGKNINLEAAGGVAGVTFEADDLNVISPTAGGNVILAGGTNISSTAAIANTVTFDLNDTISLSTIIVDNITINNEIKAPLTINTQSGGTYTFQLSDSSREVQFTNAAGVIVTIPTNAAVAFNIGSQILLTQYNTGSVQIVPAAGVTLYSTSNEDKLYERYSGAALVKQDIDEWLLVGDIKA